MTHPVSLLKCLDYDRVKEALYESFALLDVLSLFEKKSVFLKVNLMKGAPPDRALNTHPEFIRAMIQIVREQEGSAMVGDSSGLLGFTQPAFDAAGITAVVEEEGAELVNIDAGPLVRQEISFAGIDHCWTSSKVIESDVRVTLPKLKTHTLTQLTGAVKNQLGLLPGGTKPALHQIAPRVEDFCRALVAINRAVPFDLAVMDGILALEGGGSDQGKAKRAGVILASRDLVALDSIAASIMGLEPSAVPTNTIGKESGLGENDLKRIEIKGDSLTDCINPFVLPGREFKKIPFVARKVYQLRENIIKPAVEKDKCTKCGECVAVCPVDAIAMNPLPDLQDNCINCFCCYEQCPDNAMRLTSPWYFRPFVRKRLAGLALDQRS